MARGRVKENSSSRKITDSFHPIPSSRSSRTSSGPPSSPIPVKTLKQTQLTASYFRPTQKNNLPPRQDQDIIALSSGTDSASHISISSDSVVIVEHTIPDAGTGSFTGFRGVRPAAPLRILRPRSAHSIPPLVAARTRLAQMQTQERISPHRRPKLVLPRTNAPIKRKFRHESDSEGDIEEFSPPNALQTDLSRPATVSSSLSNTLATKENVPTIPTVTEKLECKLISSSPKKARISSPEPGAQPPSSGHDADVEEVIPSSQSDEQELTPSKVVKRRLSDVNKAVQEWRASSLLASPPKCPLSPSLPRDSLPAAEFDVQPDFDVPMDEASRFTDNEPAEVLVPPIAGDSQLASETEVSQQLHHVSSGSELISPIDAFSTGPTVPSSPLTNGKSATSPLPQSPRFPFGGEEDRLTTPPPKDHFPPLPPTPMALDAESKAAKMIAEIKAKALAAMSDSSDSSDEDDNDLELKELEDSSDEDLDDSLFKSIKGDKDKGKAYVFV